LEIINRNPVVISIKPNISRVPIFANARREMEKIVPRTKNINPPIASFFHDNKVSSKTSIPGIRLTKKFVMLK